MISAKIKQGDTLLIDSLEDSVLQAVPLPDSRALKPINLSYFTFIECLAELVHEYSKSKGTISFNLFISDAYVRRFDKNGDLYRHFFGLTRAWKRFAETAEDAKLFLSLLTE
jgi:hypothetical protein